MSEDEWQACCNPTTLLCALSKRVSDRKAKLFRCACRALVWRGLLRERKPDDAAGEMLARLITIAAAGEDEFYSLISDHEHRCALYWEKCPGLEEWLRWLISGTRFGPEVAETIRELWANPFPPPHFVSTWRTSTVLGLATHVLRNSDFGALPILADALQDAGCDNRHLLDHCRKPGAHLSGCWAVDLVLGLD